MTSDEVLDLKRFLTQIEIDTMAMAKAIGLDDARMTFIHTAALIDQGETRVKPIGDALGITQQAAGKTLKDMARLGYVIKEKEQDDARAISVKLDAKGRQLIQVYEAAANQWTY